MKVSIYTIILYVILITGIIFIMEWSKPIENFSVSQDTIEYPTNTGYSVDTPPTAEDCIIADLNKRFNESNDVYPIINNDGSIITHLPTTYYYQV